MYNRFESNGFLYTFYLNSCHQLLNVEFKKEIFRKKYALMKDEQMSKEMKIETKSEDWDRNGD